MEHFKKLLSSEASLSSFIPYSGCVAPGAVICRNGDLVSTFRAKGIPFETVDDAVIQSAFRQFNVFLRTVSDSRAAVIVHRVRRPVRDRLEGSYGSSFARKLADRYSEKTGEEQLMATELYITAVWRSRSKAASLFAAFREAASGSGRTREAVKEEIASSLAKLKTLSETLCASLSRYELSPLTEYRKPGRDAVYSEQLSFYNFLLTGIWQEVRVPDAPLYNVLGPAHIFAGANTLQIETSAGVRWCQSVELKEYSGTTYSGILDVLLYPDPASGRKPYSFVETQSFAFLSKPDAKAFLTQQKKQLIASEDAAVSQLDAMESALDGLENGDFSVGEYAYSLIVYGASEEDARANTLDACRKLQDEGFLPFISSIALEGSFLSQLPGNWAYRPRRARITSANFAGLAPLHNFPDGKRNGNPWGEALVLLKTASDQPYYFNLHSSNAADDSEGKKLLGNTVVIGQSGSGKTVLLNFILAMLQKYREGSKFSAVFFDKDRGSEIALRALGGGYLTIENGRPTGFNPFAALDATEENIQFLIRFLTILVKSGGQGVTASEARALSSAVRAVMAMPKEARRLALIPQNIAEGTTREEKENSLIRRLARWCASRDGTGDLAWVFDNPADELDFEQHTNFGIDGTAFLDNPMVRTPVAFYLLYRMEKIIDGRRFVFIMDEFWKWLSDPAFSGFAFDKLKTIRKQNGLGIFATQSPADVLGSDIARAVVEQSATQIFLPNPKADRSDYVEGFKLTDIEFRIVSHLAETSRMMLVKQGHRSAVCSLDLTDFTDELFVLAGSTDSVAKLDAVRREYGDDPDKWLPVFCRRCRGLPDPDELPAFPPPPENATASEIAAWNRNFLRKTAHLTPDERYEALSAALSGDLVRQAAETAGEGSL